MTVTVTDWAPEADLHLVARYAAELGERIREENPAQMFNTLAHFAHDHPAKAAQMLMCFAAWFDPDETTATLTARAAAITQSRVAIGGTSRKVKIP